MDIDKLYQNFLQHKHTNIDQTLPISIFDVAGFPSNPNNGDSIVFDSSTKKWVTSVPTVSPLTTKGDIWGYSTVNARIPVGANGTILTADSTQTLGVKWGAAGAGSVTTVSVVTNNGFVGTVSNPTTTPAITLALNSVTGVLYSGDGARILGSTIPNDDTKFLNGLSNPVYAQVKDSDLSTSDITTNNATTSKHGFLQKFPGGTTTFLRADGSFAAPSAGLVTWKGNSGAHTSGAGNITIAHGLGVTPAVFEISAYAGGTGSVQLSTNGTYDGTTNSCSYMYYTGAAQGVGNKTTRCIFLDNGGTQAEFTATWDATNVTLTANNDSLNFNYNWRAS